MMKKIFLLLVLVIFLASLFDSFCFAQRELEIEYPTVPGVETPVTTKTALPEYLRYIFTFAIIVAGLLAFGASIYGGIRYLTSAGDPTKMADARAQVTAGILGLIILLSSYLILNTINPQLVLPTKPPLQLAIGGIKIYANSIDCGKTPVLGKEVNDIGSKMIGDSYPELKIIRDSEVVLDWGKDGKYKISSIKFLSNLEDLTIKFYSENNFGEPLIKECGKDGESYEKEECKIFIAAQPKSIRLDYYPPGVYLYANDSCAGDCPSDECKIYQSSSATLPEFDNRTQSIKFIYGNKDLDTGEYKAKYATILHEKENFMGEAVVAEPVENDDCISLNWLIKLNDPSNNKGVDLTNKVSSITVYLKSIGGPIGEGVRFYEHKNHEMHDDSNECEDKTPPRAWGDGDSVPYITDYPPLQYCTNECDDNCEEEISSMEIDGHYVALLFRHEDYDGDCEVFMSSDSDFRNNRIGQCGIFGRSDCLSSFIIKARK